jgi:hypothetical protein
MKGAPGSVRSLEELGRVRLSASFFMRDFLHSEIADFHGIPNIPDAPDLAIAAGRNLCEQLLEPLQATFGRVAIRSAYRAPAVNELGNRHGLSCASNLRNYGRHIWDRRDAEGAMGAMATIVVPWFADRYHDGADCLRCKHHNLARLMPSGPSTPTSRFRSFVGRCPDGEVAPKPAQFTSSRHRSWFSP